MTTPGGGNEIEIGVGITPAGDVDAIARAVGEQSGLAYAQGVASAPPAELRPMDSGAFMASLNSLLDQTEERVAVAASNMRLRLQQGVVNGGGREGLSRQR